MTSRKGRPPGNASFAMSFPGSVILKAPVISGGNSVARSSRRSVPPKRGRRSEARPRATLMSAIESKKVRRMFFRRQVPCNRYRPIGHRPQLDHGPREVEPVADLLRLAVDDIPDGHGVRHRAIARPGRED